MESMKILVRAPNWIGDSILALPALQCLSQNYPDAEIWVATRNWGEGIFKSISFIKDVLVLPDQADLKNLRNAAQKIKEKRFDIGLLLTNSFASALSFFMASIPERWGYSKDGRRLLLTQGIPLTEKEMSRHQVHYYLGLLSRLGMKTHKPQLFFPVREDETKETEQNLLSLTRKESRLLITFHPGASYGPAKRWPVEFFISLGARLQKEKGALILITGTSAESNLADQISSQLPESSIVLTGKTSVRQLASVLKLSHLFISNDSGPMHIANALKTPVVALFGPTNPMRTGPFQEPSVVLKKDVPCWPCSYRECPFDHRCMTQISPDEVFEACQNFL